MTALRGGVGGGAAIDIGLRGAGVPAGKQVAGAINGLLYSCMYLTGGISAQVCGPCRDWARGGASGLDR